jgi:hypothetical protein
MIDIILKFLLSYFGCGAKTDNKVRGQGAWTKTFLLPTSAHLWDESHSRLSSDIESSNTFRSINLMPADRQKVDIEFIDIDR